MPQRSPSSGCATGCAPLPQWSPACVKLRSKQRRSGSRAIPPRCWKSCAPNGSWSGEICTMDPPLGIIAEITHRCPLHCVYCSNPIELNARKDELATEAWLEVFRQAGEFGVLQLFLTGGEPLARNDLTHLVRGARENKLYVNLITSGIGLNAERLHELIAAGLDHIQLSFQDSEAGAADAIAGARAHQLKLALCKEIRSNDVAFTVNIVVHRQNLARLPQMIAMAEELG